MKSFIMDRHIKRFFSLEQSAKVSVAQEGEYVLPLSLHPLPREERYELVIA